MFNSLWVAKTGMEAQDFRVQTIANNMANASTNGFKKDLAHFSSLGYSTVRSSQGKAETGDNDSSAPLMIGHGVQVAGTSKVFTQGEKKETENWTDLYIGGEGYFVLSGNDEDSPGEGPVFTRDGHFEMIETTSGSNIFRLRHVSSGRYLMGENGQNPAGTNMAVTGPTDILEIDINLGTRVTSGAGTGTFPDGVANTLHVDQDGTVWEEDGGGSKHADSVRAMIPIARFGSQAGLIPEDGNVFQDNEGRTGGAVFNDADDSGFGIIRSHGLENSNVTVIDEMVNMIEAQRGYEMGSKVLEKADEMMSTLIQRT